MASTFVHSVYFWLNPETSADEIQMFEKSIGTLLTTPGLEYASVGKPAGTRREIIDFSYTYHLLLIFKDEAAHDAYQSTDEVHQKFIADCKHLWYKIQIYDSINI